MSAALNNFLSFMVQLLVFGLEPSSDPVLKWASTGLDFNWYQKDFISSTGDSEMLLPASEMRACVLSLPARRSSPTIPLTQ
jgi:ubiquinone biosynthesis protein COQ9